MDIIKKYKQVKKLIKKSSSIFIMGHKGLDLDAIGSALALYKIIEVQNKNIYIVLNDKKHEAGVARVLNQVKDMSKDKDILDAVKLEDNIEYRFDLVREDALERGISQGILQGISQGITQGAEEKTKDIIKEMLKNNATPEFISNVTGKSIDEIKEIENSIKE